MARAGLSAIVDVRVGRAIDRCRRSAAASRSTSCSSTPTRPSTPAYFEWALKLTRQGGLIVVDNVVRDGAVVDTSGKDADVEGMRRFLARLAAESRASGTVIQTVGAKGYDGFALVVV